MEDQAAVIRDDMKDTREDLTDKLEKLEERVTESLSSAQESVTGTVESVKEGVEETVSTVRSALDIPSHVRAHPWLMMGGGVVAGYVAYQLLVPSRGTAARRSSYSASYSGGNGGGGGWGSWLSSSGMFGSGWQNIQKYAARTALDIVGRAARETLPGELGTSVGDAVEKMTAKLKDESPTEFQGGPS